MTDVFRWAWEIHSIFSSVPIYFYLLLLLILFLTPNIQKKSIIDITYSLSNHCQEVWSLGCKESYSCAVFLCCCSSYTLLGFITFQGWDSTWEGMFFSDNILPVESLSNICILDVTLDFFGTFIPLYHKTQIVGSFRCWPVLPFICLSCICLPEMLRHSHFFH